MNTDLLELPWEIQVALASGYAAYIIAYTGIRDHHKTVDTTFISIVFSLVSTAMIMLTAKLVPIASGTVALFATLLSGFLWRKWGIETFSAIMRQTNISWSDNAPSAWATLVANSRCPITQIAVELDNGTWLRCDDAAQFADAPFGPCRLGPNGDVAMYLTHREIAGQPATSSKSTRDTHYGDRLTYIPANRIQQITLRHRHSV